MSLLPLFSSWWEDLQRPHSLLDQNFGLGLSYDDLARGYSPLDTNVLVIRPPRRRSAFHHPYEKAVHSRKSGSSVVKPDKEKFTVNLDVQQFAPDEVTVKVKDRHIIIEGKHEEKQDEHGWISRQFKRKYLVPEQCDIDQVKTSLSSDGVLTLSCPRIQSIEDKGEKVIPIHQTGQPAIVHSENADVGSSSSKEPPTTPSKDASKSSGPATRAQDKSKTVKAA